MSAHPIVGAERDADSIHPDEVIEAHANSLRGSPAMSRYVETSTGRRVHAIVRGAGRPVVLLHGSGPSALLFLPLIERLVDVRAIAVDRPGFGLSEPEPVDPSYREHAVGWLDDLLDRLGLDDVALVGSSMGGTWALWYAHAHPQRVRRLVLLAAPPLSPGTRVPPPLLQLAYPDPASPPRQPPPPSRETVLGSMAIMGEAETIVDHPEQIEALIAAGRDEIAGQASLRELRAVFAPTGWQPELQIGPQELREISTPTLLVWGERDPLGGADVARDMAGMFTDARLRLVPTGHAPWLGDPGGIGGMLNEFLR